MKYSREVIDQLLDKVDLLALVRQYVDNLENRSGRWWACCPFHQEKSPSFTINLDRNSYYCFGCQAKGNAIGLVMNLEHTSFPEAMQKLAEQSNFTLPTRAESSSQVAAREAQEKKRAALWKLCEIVHKSFRQNLRSERGKVARNYLKQRGIREETVELFGLGYAVDDSRAVYQWLRHQNFSSDLLSESGLFSQRKEDVCLFWYRLIFPVFDTQGRVIAFSGRKLDESRDGPKYINSRISLIYRKRESMFGLYQSLKTARKDRQLILCEGNLDVLAFHQSGISKAVAPLGTAFTPEQAKLLKANCDNVLLAMDGDAAGQNAIYKAAFMLEREEIDSAIIPLGDDRDPADILQNEGEEGLRQHVGKPCDFFNFLKQDLTQRFALDQLGGVSQALRFLAPYLSQIKEGLRRELYIAQFAKLFGLKQEILAQEASWQYRPVDERREPPQRESRGESRGDPEPKTVILKRESPAPQPAQRLSRVEFVEREFWASMLLQADLYPDWQERLASYPWGSADALLIKDLLDRAAERQDFNFETLCDRVSHRVPALGQWLLQKSLEPLQGGNIYDSEGYDVENYRRSILEQKFCGLREFWLRQRKTQVLEQIRRLEQQNSEPNLLFELLHESQDLDLQLIEIRKLLGDLQQELVQSTKLSVENQAKISL